MTYEVQHFTICDGWVNTWSLCAEDGTPQPETFATSHQAHAALNDFLLFIQQEIDAGTREADEGYDREEFRVVACAPQAEKGAGL